MTLYLLAGAAAGYALLIGTIPVRASLLDGVRAVQRYPRLWVLLGLFGFAYALFDLGRRAVLAVTLPVEEAPKFLWARSAYREQGWWSGNTDSFWYVAPGSIGEVAKSAVLPALDQLGGLFNNVLSTFPLAAVAALFLLLNWRGHQTTLRKALAKRFGKVGWLLYPLILIAAVGAIAKPALNLVLRYPMPPVWYQWAPVVAWLGFIFEYLLGVCVQVYLLSLAYCWLRGLSFGHQQLLDFAIRRFAFVARWAFVVLLLSTLLVDLPLILMSFQAVSDQSAVSAATIDFRNALARAVLNVVFISFAAVQVTLLFRNESLRRSIRDHWRFVGKHPGAIGWFIIVAAVHLYLLQFVDALCRAALGDGTAAWVSWTLLFPWIAGFVAACLLAAWVSVFRRAESGRLADKHFARF